MRPMPTGIVAAGLLLVLSCRATAQLVPPDSGYTDHYTATYDDEPGYNHLAPEFSVGVGYTHISIGDSDSLLHSEDALRFDPVVSFSPVAKVPQFRLGAALGVSMVIDNSERTIISNGGVIIVGSSDVPFLTLEPEVRASWRQPFGKHDAFYVEPGLAIGSIVGHLDIDASDTDSGRSFDDWEGDVAGRFFFAFGARVPGGIAGVEASYARGGSLHFAENASGDVEQFYVGFFGALRF